jgi:hypothetical protein
MSVFRDVCKFDKETCVGSRNFPNALKKTPNFVAKTSFPKWLQTGVFHQGHVFHFFNGDRANDCIGLLLLGPIVISQGDGNVYSVDAAKFVLGKVSRRKIL